MMMLITTSSSIKVKPDRRPGVFRAAAIERLSVELNEWTIFRVAMVVPSCMETIPVAGFAACAGDDDGGVVLTTSGDDTLGGRRGAAPAGARAARRGGLLHGSKGQSTIGQA